MPQVSIASKNTSVSDVPRNLLPFPISSFLSSMYLQLLMLWALVRILLPATMNPEPEPWFIPFCFHGVV